MTADGPDVVALQEVTSWALQSLETWSGMQAFWAVTTRGVLGPLARLAHRLDPVHVRSRLTGQANALLVHPRLPPAEPPRTVVLRPGGRLERRVCQLLRVRAGGRRLTLANLHATAHYRDVARQELDRVAELVATENPCIVCGDFNVPRGGIEGFSSPIEGLDQILVRGLALEQPPARWPKERLRVDGVLLSDHAPVEAVVG